MSKVSMEELLGKTDNIYESVAVMARRARQINDIQKRQIDQERDTLPVIDLRDSEDFEDVEIDREALNREYTKMPKPTRLAIEQMRDGFVDFRYKNEED
ncbi:DNA-directed RNA polymerase subunit omega [bacterium]